jgi:hypothetical protein
LDFWVEVLADYYAECLRIKEMKRCSWNAVSKTLELGYLGLQVRDRTVYGRSHNQNINIREGASILAI